MGGENVKGERTLRDTPFRFGGIEHNFDKDAEQWAAEIPKMRRCWSCGGMMRNVRSLSGTLLHTSYQYVASFNVTKGKGKGSCWFKTLCRYCAYAYGVGVIEMDGNTYQKPEDFNEAKYKKETNYKYDGVT